VETHIYHGIADVVVCLLGFAVLINSMYVIFYDYKMRNQTILIVSKDPDSGK